MKANCSGDRANIQLIDSRGVVLTNNNITTSNQTIDEQINLSKYPSGLFILKITDLHGVRHQQVVKE
jgi:hypothetical protein